MIDRDKIAELRRLEAEATPGPWDVSGLTVYDTCMDSVASTHSAADAALIVAMRNALPELLKALEWRSISSAPREEPVLLAWFDTFFERWDYDTNFAFIGDVKHGLATHWRHLPLPPHGVDYAS